MEKIGFEHLVINLAIAQLKASTRINKCNLKNKDGVIRLRCLYLTCADAPNADLCDDLLCFA